MYWLYFLFGEGKELNMLQMGSRSVVVFVICLILLRISGRRSFGLKTPLDNIIVILLGTMIGRAVVGASPFVPVIFGSLIFVLLHRLLGWLVSRNKNVCKFIEGDKICLYKDNHFVEENLKKGLVSEEDVMQGVRKSALTKDIGKIDSIYMERNGEISPIKAD